LIELRRTGLEREAKQTFFGFQLTR
jgi:hypothetical protein